MKFSKSGKNKYRILRNQLSSLFLYESIETGTAMAKALKKEAEKVLGLIKKERELDLRRLLKSILYGRSAEKVMEEKESYGSISIYRVGRKFGDGSEKSIVKINKTQPKQKTKKDSRE